MGVKEKLSYVAFDDLFSQGVAESDPIGFVDSLSRPVFSTH